MGLVAAVASLRFRSAMPWNGIRYLRAAIWRRHGMLCEARCSLRVGVGLSAAGERAAGGNRRAPSGMWRFRFARFESGGIVATMKFNFSCCCR